LFRVSSSVFSYLYGRHICLVWNDHLALWRLEVVHPAARRGAAAKLLVLTVKASTNVCRAALLPLC
jgi:hypothetical protein